jgi:plasmid stabilization system protein ParE
MHDSVLETCTLLGENPYIAAELQGLSVAGVRRFQVKHYPRYSIFYEINETHVEIIRVGFGGRDWEELVR